MEAENVEDRGSPEDDTIKNSSDSFECSAKLRDFITKSGKNPISLFTELYRTVFKSDPDPYVRGTPSADDPNKCDFVCTVVVGSERISGSAMSKKKSARFDCYHKALQVLFDKYLCQAVSSSFNVKFHEQTTVFELIRQMAYAKFSSLLSENPSLMDADKVIASITMFNAADRSLNVISLATGNKCIRGESLSLSGESLNDCHAEIVAKRGLRRFLLAQVLLYLRSPEKSIFIPHDSGRLTVRPSISFHLFINTAPCGDARVYDRAEKIVGDNENAGKLRFKLENGMGTVLGEGDCAPQTIDGIFGGERLRTMSCTDKILRWNYLGVQGALLGKFTLPIYLASISIGDAQDGDRIQRGLSGRLEGLPPSAPFYVHSIHVGLCQPDALVRKCERNLNISTNWNVADDSVEVVNTYTGRLEKTGGTSRLSKKEFAVLFKEVCKTAGKPVPAEYTYKKLKLASGDYSTAQNLFTTWLDKEGLGQWQRKPEETGDFYV